MTVADMNARMTTREYVEWQVYYMRKRQREEKAMRQVRSKRR